VDIKKDNLESSSSQPKKAHRLDEANMWKNRTEDSIASQPQIIKRHKLVQTADGKLVRGEVEYVDADKLKPRESTSTIISKSIKKDDKTDKTSFELTGDTSNYPKITLNSDGTVSIGEDPLKDKNKVIIGYGVKSVDLPASKVFELDRLGVSEDCIIRELVENVMMDLSTGEITRVPINRLKQKEFNNSVYWCSNGICYTDIKTRTGYKESNISLPLYLGDTKILNKKEKGIYFISADNLGDDDNLWVHDNCNVSSLLKFNGKTFELCTLSYNFNTNTIEEIPKPVGKMHYDWYAKLLSSFPQYKVGFMGNYFMIGDKVCILNNDDRYFPRLKGNPVSGCFVVPNGCVSFGAISHENISRLTAIVFPESIRVCNFHIRAYVKRGFQFCFSSKTPIKSVIDILELWSTLRLEGYSEDAFNNMDKFDFIKVLGKVIGRDYIVDFY
jgi:hypothetical protein